MVFSLIQVTLSVVLIGLILLQSKGAGLGSAFGGEMGFYRSRRGAEKMLFILTIVVAVIFLSISIIRVLL